MTDDRVSAFYEAHPYPPPVDDLDAYRRAWDDARRRAESHLFWPAEPYRDDRSILVAGCGTVQAAHYALRWPGARVVGIDVSANSIAHTRELKRRHALDNLELHQLAVENAAELGQTFEQVVCTGVLHHLSDPDCRPARAARRARAERRAPSHGVRALWPRGHLHAPGLLQAARHRAVRFRDSRSRGQPQSASAGPSARAAAAQLTRFCRHRGTCRCAAPSARPLVLRAAVARVSRRRGPCVRSLAASGAVSALVRCVGATSRITRDWPNCLPQRSSPRSNSSAVRWFAMRPLPIEATPRNCRPSISRGTRGSTTCRSGCRIRSRFGNGYRPGQPRCLINRNHTYTDSVSPDRRAGGAALQRDRRRSHDRPDRSRCRRAKPRARRSSCNFGAGIKSCSTDPCASRPRCRRRLRA